MSTLQIARRFINGDIKKLLKNSIWTIGSTVFISGLYVVEIMLLARYVSAEQLGIYFIIISYPELIQAILDLRVNEVLIKYMPGFLISNRLDYASALIKLLWTANIIVSLLGLILVSLTSGWVSKTLLDTPEYSSFIVLFSFGLLGFSLGGVSISILRVFGRFDLSFLGSALSAVIRLSLIIFSLEVYGNILSLVISRAIASGISAVIFASLCLILVKKHIPRFWEQPICVFVDQFKEIGKFTLNINFSSTLTTLSAKLDVIVLGLLLSPSVVAVYKLAVQFAKTLYLISDSLMAAIYPQLSYMVAHNLKTQLIGLLKRVNLLMLLVSSGTVLTMIFWGKHITEVFAGSQYLNQSEFFVRATFMVLPATYLFWVNPLILCLSKPDFLVKGNLLGIFVGISSLLLLTYLFGLEGSLIGFGALISLPPIANTLQLVTYIKGKRIY